MSRKKTSQSNSCDHISKVAEWGYKLIDGQVHEYAALWGCTRCDATSETLWETKETFVKIDHSNCVYDPCFGCKAKGLQFGTGDANSKVIDSNTTQKKWNSELEAYRQARADGIQPAGTTRGHVEAAYKASETLGTAYNADNMPKAKDINKNTAEVLKHVGMV
mgnify:FL=1